MGKKRTGILQETFLHSLHDGGELTTLRDGPTLEATGVPAADSGSGNPKGQQPPGLCLVLAHLAR